MERRKFNLFVSDGRWYERHGGSLILWGCFPQPSNLQMTFTASRSESNTHFGSSQKEPH